MSQPTYLINEIFVSIEGETSYQGIPMLFVRLTGCNLRCKYCDTTYAYFEGEEYTLERLLEEIDKSRSEFVHLTGGEPLIHKNIDVLIGSIKNKKILIETNGSVDITPFQKENTVIILDVKTPGSGEEGANFYRNLEIVREIDEIKFVITNKDDYLWAKRVIEKIGLIEKGCVVNLSPAIPYLEPCLLAEWILNDGIKVRFNLQIHKFIWGDKRGV